MDKKIKLTNWQVPRDPQMARFDAFAKAPPLDPKRYEKVGGVEHHDSVQSVAEKMIAKQEAAMGRKIDQVDSGGPKVNLNGIVDDRKNKVMFSFPRRK